MVDLELSTELISITSQQQQPLVDGGPEHPPLESVDQSRPQVRRTRAIHLPWWQDELLGTRTRPAHLDKASADHAVRQICLNSVVLMGIVACLLRESSEDARPPARA